MKSRIIVAVILASGLASAQAQAFDIGAGKKLLNENCYACHGNDVYTRKDRMINNRSSLSTQVQRCQLAQNLQWFNEDVENVAEYLSIQFYHFNK